LLNGIPTVDRNPPPTGRVHRRICCSRKPPSWRAGGLLANVSPTEMAVVLAEQARPHRDPANLRLGIGLNLSSTRGDALIAYLRHSRLLRLMNRLADACHRRASRCRPLRSAGPPSSRAGRPGSRPPRRAAVFSAEEGRGRMAPVVLAGRRHPGDSRRVGSRICGSGEERLAADGPESSAALSRSRRRGDDGRSPDGPAARSGS